MKKVFLLILLLLLVIVSCSNEPQIKQKVEKTGFVSNCCREYCVETRVYQESFSDYVLYKYYYDYCLYEEIEYEKKRQMDLAEKDLIKIKECIRLENETHNP